MAINLNDLANALTGAQAAPEAPRASRDQYGTIALDAHGTPTVMLDGGEDYAPCTCMVGVHHGDRVLAHVVNHKIVVFANITAPTTDDAQALVAIDKADAAAEAADAAGIAAASAQADATAAKADAATAKSAAQGAVSDAADAKAAATQAQADAASAAQDAATAKQAATDATTTANGAVTALATVQGVVDQLETDVDELQVHVAMMDAYSDGHGGTVPAGLHVVPTGSGYFLVIANDGTYVYDAQSVLVTKFGESIDFSSTRPQRIGNDTAYVEYYDSDNDGIPDSIRISGTNLNTEIANFRQTVSETYATKSEAKQTDSASGLRELPTEDAAELPLLTLTAYGECSQDGTPTPDAPVPIKAVRGRNLLRMPSWEEVSSATQTSGYRNISIPLKPNTKYTISTTYKVGGNPNNGGYALISTSPTNNDWKSISHKGAGIKNGTVTTKADGLLYLNVYMNQNEYEHVLEYARPMLVEGDVYSPYVPYGSVAVICTGKNIFDSSNLLRASSWTESDGVYSGTIQNLYAAGVLPIAPTTGAVTISFDYMFSDGRADSTSNGPTVSIKYSDGTDSAIQYARERGQWSHWEFTVTSEKLAVGMRFGYVKAGAIDIKNVQVELGTEATEYEPYRESVSHIDLKGEELCSLPDGTQDVLTVDASGHVEIEKLVAYTDAATTDGVSATVGTDAWSTTGDLSDGADVYYPLAEPRTIDLGYITPPTTFDGGAVHVDAEIQPVIDASWWTKAGYETGKAYNDGNGSADLAALTERVTTAESSITQQAGEIALKANAADTYTKAQTDASLTLKANKATLTSEINASADTVKIDATRVNIEGAAIFTGSGRLSQTSLDFAYDANGAAADAVGDLTTDLASSTGTTVINGGHIATDSLTIGQVSNLQSTLDDAAKTATNYVTEVTGGGIKVHDANDSSDYVQITSDGMDVYNDGTNVARFGADGAQIGKTGAAHSVIDANGQRFYGGSNGATQLANIGYGQGSGTGSGASTTPYYTFGTRYEAASAYDPSNVYTIGDLCLHDGNLYICTSRTVTGEWNDLYWVLAIGNNSLVAGSLNCAARESSQAFGYRTKAVGSYALATGIDSIAWGAAAHAHNRGTWASTNQTAIGKYNEIDYGSTLAFIIGNGTADNARSNAAVIDWLGNYIAQGWAGVIQMFAGSTPPAGWLLCDGSAVSREDYAVLYAAIGDTWGAGDGSTTFNLPDLRGRAPIGAGTGSGLTARTLGGSGGSEDAIIPYHRHAMGAHTHADPGSAFLTNNSTVARRTVSSGSGATNQLYSAGATERKTATGAMNGSPYTGYAGSDGNTVNANMQPFAVVNYIIHTGKTN